MRRGGWQSVQARGRTAVAQSRRCAPRTSSYLQSTAPCRRQSTLSALKDQLLAYHRRQHDGMSDSKNDDLALADEAASHDMRWLLQGAKEKGNSAWEEILTRMVRDVVEEDKPIAYVLGNIPFHPLPRPLLIRPPTLIPRPETEHWVGELATTLSSKIGSSRSRTSFRILDIGTGSGCIPIALAFALSAHSESPPPLIPRFTFVGVDISSSALALAQDNLNLFDEYFLPVAFSSADVFRKDFASLVLRQLTSNSKVVTSPDDVSLAYDLIVANPPYITESDYKSLDGSVSKWEDKGALVGGGGVVSTRGEINDGLQYYRRIISLLPELLRQSSPEFSAHGEVPSLVLEVGLGQGEEVAKMIESKGWRAEVRKDPWGIDRVVYGYRIVTRD